MEADFIFAGLLILAVILFARSLFGRGLHGLVVAFIIVTACGCARQSSWAEERRVLPDGTTITRRIKSKTGTLFEGQSALTDQKINASDAGQSLSIGSLHQEVTATNLGPTITAAADAYTRTQTGGLVTPENVNAVRAALQEKIAREGAKGAKE